MSAEILGFLRYIVVPDGSIDKSVATEIDRIEAIFNSGSKFSLNKKLRAGWGSIKRAITKAINRKN
jgi:hypothetical protein